MYIRAIVTADEKRDRLTKTKDGTYTISVRAPASGNLANERVRELIAREYDVSTKQVHIISGQHRQGKMIRVDN